MTHPLLPVRGMRDLWGQDLEIFRHILQVAYEQASYSGFSPIATPILERVEVFQRPLGETSDVVGKEMYTFTDRGGEDITLRPEGTAPIVRALISNGLTQFCPLKLSYDGPMFRYERPQKGRYRQFHQMGVEHLGEAHPFADVEIIALADGVLKALGVKDRVTLQINTLGSFECRKGYRERLRAYFEGVRSHLSEESQTRIDKNPLRILDSKSPQDHPLIENAPLLDEDLDEGSQAFFQKVCEGLTQLSIPYVRNARLVRGLDYYTHTTFEFVTDHLGAQGTVLAGGRYDELVHQMGGGSLPGVGWAMGVDRLMLMTTAPLIPIPSLAVIGVGEEAEVESAVLERTHHLRELGHRVHTLYGKKSSKQLKEAHKKGVSYALFVGMAEIEGRQILLKDMATGIQESVPWEAIGAYLRQHYQNSKSMDQP